MTKDILKKTIDALPDHFTIEDVIEELIVIDKIERGMRDVEKGNVLTNKPVLNLSQEIQLKFQESHMFF